MFDSAFKTNLMDETQSWRYRQVVLEKGGSLPEMETLMNFLGRTPSPVAFYRELGII